MTYFDFLKNDKQFESFADIAIATATDNNIHVDIATLIKIISRFNDV